MRDIHAYVRVKCMTRNCTLVHNNAIKSVIFPMKEGGEASRERLKADKSYVFSVDVRTKVHLEVDQGSVDVST